VRGWRECLAGMHVTRPTRPDSSLPAHTLTQVLARTNTPIRTHPHAHRHARTYTNTHTHTQIHIHTHIHTRTRTNAQVHTHARAFTRRHALLTQDRLSVSQNARATIQDTFSKFDSDNSGGLDITQLGALLLELNEGEPVSEEETKWVMEHADVLGNNTITKPELIIAISLWYPPPPPRPACIVCEQACHCTSFRVPVRIRWL